MRTPDFTHSPAERAAAPIRRPHGPTVSVDEPIPAVGAEPLRAGADPAAEPEGRSARPTARGPLLAVCGLCGGAGASTLAYLVALSGAGRRSGPVLVCDTGGPGGGLAAYAGVAAPRSLAEIAEQLAAGLPAGRLYATTDDGVRVLATGPRFAAGCAGDGVELVLEHARAAHALTVVDCGTLTREAEQIALARATHVAWVLPATPSGVRRGARVLDAVNPYLLGRELLVARRDEREPKAALGELKRLAEQRRAPLILLPHLPELSAGTAADALERAQVSLQALHGRLER